MEILGPLVVHSAMHPSSPVDRLGFPLDHPYVEQCLLPVLGPSSVLFMRRMPELWKVAHPFETTFEELAPVLGLQHFHLSQTVKRLVKFGFADQPATDQVEVFTRCAPLTSRVLKRLPSWAQATHARMLDEHIAQLVRTVEDGAARPEVSQRLDHAPTSSQLTEHVDRLRQHAPTTAQVLGR